MKYLSLFILLLSLSFCIISCEKEIACEEINTGEIFEFKTGDEFCFNDTEIKIIEVLDQRCPCFALCKWEGEFVFNIQVTKNEVVADYQLHEKIELDETAPFGLDFTFEKIVSDDGCGGEIDTSTITFSMRVE